MSESKENKQEALQKENEYKVTWKGWVSLAFLTISFSGLVAHQDNFLKAFDLMNLMGQFGHADGAKIAMQGTGGFGAREGFAFALTMVPVTMLAQGLIETCEHLGALKAAGKLFQPFLRQDARCPVGQRDITAFVPYRSKKLSERHHLSSEPHLGFRLKPVDPTDNRYRNFRLVFI